MCDVYVYTYKHERLGGSGGMFPQKNFKLDALILLLRPFWDRSRAIVATWLAEYCIQFLAVHVCICYPSWHWISMREGTKVERTADITRRITGELLSHWNIDYLRTSFHRSCVNSLRTRPALVLCEQTACIAITRLILLAVILNSSETSGPLINGRQLKMYSEVVEAKRGVRANPL